MQILYPVYYHDFQCLADKCPDSCCKDWTVQIDETSAQYYRQLSGPLGDTLRDALQEESGDTILALTSDGRCPMWRKDGLCRIHAELGESHLCHTCKEFPRLRHDYGDFVELGLELSCPEAARLLLSQQDCTMLTSTLPGGDLPEYDGDAMKILLESRQIILNFLIQTTMPIEQALSVLLLYGYDVQICLDGGSFPSLDPQKCLERAKSVALSADKCQFFDFFKNLEILNPSWLQRLNAPQGPPWRREHLAMARYLVQRYWLQAVSDYDLVGRVKFVVLSCLLVRELGGNVYQTAQQYSKEIENNLDNLEAVWDAAYTSPALADRNLLGYLLA